MSTTTNDGSDGGEYPMAASSDGRQAIEIMSQFLPHRDGEEDEFEKERVAYLNRQRDYHGNGTSPSISDDYP